MLGMVAYEAKTRPIREAVPRYRRLFHSEPAAVITSTKAAKQASRIYKNLIILSPQNWPYGIVAIYGKRGVLICGYQR